MFALYDLDTAMNEYQQKLRTAEEGRRASKFEQRYARKLARQVARLAGLAAADRPGSQISPHTAEGWHRSRGLTG